MRSSRTFPGSSLFFRRLVWGFATVGAIWATATMAAPAVIPLSADQGLLCQAAIRQAEQGSGLPPHLLAGIARVESGRRDPITGRVAPWPWTINADGKGSYFETKAEAVAYTKQLQAYGVRSIDTGCMQINLMHHPDAFRDLEEAFDPAANARYAVKFLTQLREKTGSWETASAWYHSANPGPGNAYRALVVAAMAEDTQLSDGQVPLLAFGPAGGGPVRSMPAGLGKYAMPVRMGATTNNASPSRLAADPQGAASSPTGRGLDAYRQHPVPLVGPRLATAR